MSESKPDKKFKIEKMCMGENGKLICCRCKKECEPRKNYTINVVVDLGETKQIYDLCDKCTQELEKWIMSYRATKNIAPCPSCKTSNFDDIFIRVIGGYKIAHLCKYRAIESSTIFETKDKAIEFWNNHNQQDHNINTLPSFVTIHNAKYKIDDEVNEGGVFKIFSVLQDESLLKNERIKTALTLFYKDINSDEDIFNVFGDYVDEAIKKMYGHFELIADKLTGVNGLPPIEEQE